MFPISMEERVQCYNNFSKTALHIYLSSGPLPHMKQVSQYVATGVFLNSEFHQKILIESRLHFLAVLKTLLN